MKEARSHSGRSQVISGEKSSDSHDAPAPPMEMPEPAPVAPTSNNLWEEAPRDKEQPDKEQPDKEQPDKEQSDIKEQPDSGEPHSTITDDLEKPVKQETKIES